MRLVQPADLGVAETAEEPELNDVAQLLVHRAEHESRALGRLRHPGIAQVLEAGTFGTGANAQPFIAMALVSGSSLTDYAREHRATSTGNIPRKSQKAATDCAASDYAPPIGEEVAASRATHR